MKISNIRFCPGNLIEMKNMYESRTRLNEKKDRENIFYVNLNNLSILPVRQILFLFLFASFEIWQTIPILICTAVGSVNIFLFLFVGEVTIRCTLVQSSSIVLLAILKAVLSLVYTKTLWRSYRAGVWVLSHARVFLEFKTKRSANYSNSSRELFWVSFVYSTSVQLLVK